ncbi:MAG: LamG-like jellyroll fold domain-containing protein [Limisphaerales bacterium]
MNIKWFATSVLAVVCIWAASSAIAQAPYPSTNSYSRPWLDYWPFSDTNNWTTALGYAPVSFTNVGVSCLGDGTALVVDDSTNAAWLQYNVWEKDGTTNLTVDVGSVMLWFAPDWSSQSQGGDGPGSWAPLIETGAFTTNANNGWWSWYCDPQGSNILFSAQDGLGDQTNYLCAPISWNSNQFHFLALTYSSTNTALYIDGSFVTNGPGITIYPSSEVLSNGFWLGSDSSGTNQCHGILDDVSTYNYPLDADTISSAFVLSEIFYLRNMAMAANIVQAPSTPETAPIFDAITGLGYLLPNSTNMSGWVSSSNVWITNTTATVTTNGTVISFTIAGGVERAGLRCFCDARVDAAVDQRYMDVDGAGESVRQLLHFTGPDEQRRLFNSRHTTRPVRQRFN